jgi:hypothetical protein
MVLKCRVIVVIVYASDRHPIGVAVPALATAGGTVMLVAIQSRPALLVLVLKL